MAITSERAQAELEKALAALPNYFAELPEALKPLLKLAPPKGQRAKISRRADAISVSYEAVNARPPKPAKRPEPAKGNPAREMVHALASAEAGRQFVVLKWFRDTYLPQAGYGWAATPDDRHNVLAEAIQRRWILTSRIPNPRNPQFPVTAIRVNRALAEVRAILGQDRGERLRFAPIAIPGEPLSATVLRERR